MNNYHYVNYGEVFFARYWMWCNYCRWYTWTGFKPWNTNMVSTSKDKGPNRLVNFTMAAAQKYFMHTMHTHTHTSVMHSYTR